MSISNEQFLSQIKKLNTPEKLSSYMKANIKYGYIRRDTNKVETNDFDNFYLKYSLMSPKEVHESGVGICWDQTLFEKYVFDNIIKKYDYKIFFLQQENINESTHTFLVYTKNNKYYYFENAFEEYAGIKEFKSYDEAISYVANNIRKSEGPDNGIYVNDLGKSFPKINSTCKEFCTFCQNKKELKMIKYTNEQSILNESNNILPSPINAKYVYVGTTKKYNNYIDKGNVLFVTPYKRIAALFTYNRDILSDGFSNKIHHCNIGYEEWNFNTYEANTIPNTINIRIEGDKNYKNFNFVQEGYIYKIDTSKYKLYRYPWMDENKEAIILDKNVEISEIENTKILFKVKGYDKMNKLNEQSILNESNKPLYFYHLAPKGINKNSKGLYSLQYLYDHKMYDLFDKYTDKYRYRICYLWGYSDKKSYELTREEVIKYLKRFRDDDQLDEIYFFRFPPYYELGDHMKQILENKDIYRIDINDPTTKNYIKDIYWGTDGSQSDNIELDRDYYVNIDQDDYFKRYNNKSQMNFASLNHISIRFRNGYCPFFLLTKIKTPTKMINENSVIQEGIVVSNKDTVYNLDKFISGEVPILFISGMSGSGKSFLGKKMASEYNAEYIEMDMMNAELKKIYGESFSRNKNPEFYVKTYIDLFKDLVVNKNKRLVVEGVQICSFPIEFLSKFAIYILGTSYLKSTFRAIKRQFEPEHIERYGKKFEILFYIKGNITFYKNIRELNKKVKSLIKKNSVVQEGIQIKEEEGQQEICEILDNTPFNRIYLTSDLHFHKLEQDQFDNKVDESRKRIKEAITKQNKTVNDNDVYIVLGDIAHRRNQSKFLDMIKDEYNQMKGIKILVKGNHDTLNNDFYHECGFDIVVNMFTWKNYVFTHEPIPVDGDRINIHGHIHEEKIYINMGWKNHINVFCEYYNMYPISLEDALNKYNKGFYTGRTVYDPSYPYYNQMDVIKDNLIKLECSGLDYKQELEMAIIHNNKLEVDNLIKGYHEGVITRLELLDKLKDIEDLPKSVIIDNDIKDNNKSYTESETVKIQALNKVKDVGDVPNDVEQTPHHKNNDEKENSKSTTETVMNQTLVATLKDAIYDDEIIDIDKAVYVIPFFNPEEMQDMGIYGEHNFYKVNTENNDDKKKWFDNYKLFSKGFLTEEFVLGQSKWINELNKLYMDYSRIKASGNENDINIRKQSILELGWNPEIEFNEKTRKIVFENNIHQYKDKYKDTSIDATFLDRYDPKVMTEGKSGEELYPVYILITYTKTAFGKIIRKATHGKYTHAAISLDASMNNLFSFNAGDSGQSGFTTESLKRYNHDDECIMCVHVFFVDKIRLRKIKTKLDWFLLNKKSLHYSYLNCLTLLFNKVVELNNAMICSQFVDFLMKDIDVDVTHKPSPLVTPNDFSAIENNNPNVYKVYEGAINKYDYKKVEKIVNKLQKSAKPIVELCMPIQEAKSFPVQFDRDGNLLIKNYRNNKLDINEEYWKSHKLLLNYEKNVEANKESIKYELAKLWFLNIILESKIYRNKDEDDINDYQVIRARVLNDFNKYIKMIPGFNFTEYYNDSPFSDATIKIDKHTLKYSIKYLRDILKLSIK